MMNQSQISSDDLSITVRCDRCFRKIAAVVNYTGEAFVDVKHKGIEVMTPYAIVTCPSCKTIKHINAPKYMGEATNG